MKNARIFFAVFSLVLLCGGCAYEYQNENALWDAGMQYMPSSLRSVCFAGTYVWDGNESTMAITIPDEYEGYKVTALGGYAGHGGGVPLDIWIEGTEEYVESPPTEAVEIVPYPFQLHIGKNVKEIALSKLTFYRRIGDANRCAQILLTVTCSDENKTFYAKDGKLYRRADDTLVEGFWYYWDEDISVWPTAVALHG